MLTRKERIRRVVEVSKVLQSLHGTQTYRVYEALATTRHWLTVDEIAAITGERPASVSARIRDLRKPEFGRFQILRQKEGDTYKYRLKVDWL